MNSCRRSSLVLRADVETWHLKSPFRITGRVWDSFDVLTVSLEKDGQIGRGEAAGVYYRGETAASMLQQIESQRATIEAGLSLESVQKLLPAGGARNALDCALWDLEAKLSGRPAWQLAELEEPQKLMTTFTCGADEPRRMAAVASTYRDALAIKLKLTGDPADADRVRAVREARSDVWLGVDANQGFTRAHLEKLLPTLIETRVALIEQPFAIGHDALLDGLQLPIPVAADESVQGLADIAGLAGRFNVVNVKLDKCGGLTEALSMVRAARASGLRPMVGCMTGTSLAMAPAYLVGQLCDIVDLDSPTYLKRDRSHPARYSEGFFNCPEMLWGHCAGPRLVD
jgi:L-alanine-DL-glutamate epimerase-like enolase superfamily enzyme